MPKRILNWDVLATHWALEQVGQPFAWGSTDCATLALEMWRVIYGEPLMDRRYYENRTGALRFQAETKGARSWLTTMGAVPLELLVYANTGDVLIAPPREDEPFDGVFPVITDRFLFVEPGSVVQLLPFTQASPDVVPYRLPHGW